MILNVPSEETAFLRMNVVHYTEMWLSSTQVLQIQLSLFSLMS